MSNSVYAPMCAEGALYCTTLHYTRYLVHWYKKKSVAKRPQEFAIYLWLQYFFRSLLFIRIKNQNWVYYSVAMAMIELRQKLTFQSFFTGHQSLLALEFLHSNNETEIWMRQTLESIRLKEHTNRKCYCRIEIHSLLIWTIQNCVFLMMTLVCQRPNISSTGQVFNLQVSTIISFFEWQFGRNHLLLRSNHDCGTSRKIYASY